MQFELIKKYFSHDIVEKIIDFEGNIKTINEYKNLTIIVINIEDIFEHKNVLSQEKEIALLREIIQLIDKIISKKGAYLKLSGNLVICAFGLSFINNQELVAAVTAIDLKKELDILIKNYQATYSIILNMPIIGDSGKFLVGNFNPKLKLDLSFVGNNFNNIFEIFKICSNNDIFITDELYQKVRNYTETKLLTGHPLKNKLIYNLINIKDIKIATKAKNDFFGRKNEIDTILSNMKNDSIKVIILESEKGAGKSRIVEEIISIIDTKDIIYFANKSNRYFMNFYWQPFKELFNYFNNYFNSLSYEIDFKDKNKINIEANFINTFFNKIDSLTINDVPLDSIFESFRLFLKYLSEIKKIVIIIEDIEYLDEFSHDLLKYLLNTSLKSEIKFLLTKDKELNWVKNSDFVQNITIDNLDIKTTGVIIEEYLAGNTSEKLIKDIYNKTKGNCLYLYELLKYLTENNLIMLTNDIYDVKDFLLFETLNLQDIISGKIALLTPLEKQFLRISSFFGKFIYYDILSKIFESNVDELIDILHEKDFLYQRIINNRKVIFFYSQTICELIKITFSDQNDTEIHKNIAKILIEEYDNRIDKIFERIAFHLDNAGKYINAVYYYFIAGIKYRNSGDFKSSEHMFEKALYLAESLQSKEKSQILFTDKQIECFDFNITELYFKYKIKFYLSIEVIYYFYAQTLNYSNNNKYNYYEKSMNFSEKNNNEFFIMLSGIALFKKSLYETSEIDTALLKKTLSIAVKYKNTFFEVLIRSQYIKTVKDYKKISERSKNIIRDFVGLRKRIETLQNDSEDQKVLLIYWYKLSIKFYSLMNKDLAQIVNMIRLCEENFSSDYYRQIFIDDVLNRYLKNTKYEALFLNKVIELSERINYFTVTAKYCAGLSYLYLQHENYEKSFEVNEKARIICEDINDRFELGMIYKNLGDFYLTTDKINEAYDNFWKSVFYKRQFPGTLVKTDFTSIIIPLSALSFCSLKLGKMDETENIIKELDQLSAKNIYEKDISIFIDFIRYLYKYKKNNFDKVYLERVKDAFNEFSKIFPKSYQMKWLSKEMELL